MPTTSPLRPNATLNSGWGGSNPFTLIDDATTQPTAGGTSDYAYYSGDSSAAQQYGCASPTNTGLITSAKLWVYLKFDSNSDGDISAVRIRLNGVWRSGTLTGKPSSGAWGWASCTVTGEYGGLSSSTPAFELTYSGASIDGEVYVDVAYLEITYVDMPTLSGAPVVEGVAVTHFSANQTTHTVNLPSGIASGDLLLLWFSKDGTSGTITTPSGWSIAISTITATDQSILFSRTASGSEDTTVSVTTSISESSTCIAYRISGWTEVVYANTTVSTTMPYFPPSTIATETAGTIAIAMYSGTGAVAEPAELSNGPIAWTVALGNSADSGNTVAAYSQAAIVNAVEGVEVYSFPWRYGSNTSGRLISVAVHGTAASGGSGGLYNTLSTGLVR